jgi:hypothetical protein
MKLKHIVAAAGVFVLLSLFSLTCLAADKASYQIDIAYSVVNTSGADIDGMYYEFDLRPVADGSAYQPDTQMSRSFSGATLTVADGRENYTTDLAADGSNTVTFTWTFSGGGFDQFPAKTDTYEAALAAYKFVTENISYGAAQCYAEPEIATCETFVAAYYDLLTEAGIECRKVYGYSIRLVDSDGNVTYGESDISGFNLHVWLEWYDPDSDMWVFTDPTFDDENTDFRFFGRCPDDSPHLAMYYGGLPKCYISWVHRDDVEITRTATLKRAEYTDADEGTENLLERMERLESEAAVLAEYAASKGLTFTIDRDTAGFSLSNGRHFAVPPDRTLYIDEFGDLCIDAGPSCVSGSRSIRFQFAPSGAMRMFAC